VKYISHSTIKVIFFSVFRIFLLPPNLENVTSIKYYNTSNVNILLHTKYTHFYYLRGPGLGSRGHIERALVFGLRQLAAFLLRRVLMVL